LVDKLEQDGDDLRVILIAELNSAFVTPIDREDIFALSKAIDDLADYSKSTVEEVLLFNIQPDKYLMKIADALLTAATEINIALENLREHPASSSGHVLKAKKTENFIEHRYREGLAELFTHDDFQYIFRHREIYRHLSNAADKVDLAADILSDIIIKSI
ncbi:MAG TPA: DUF47 family protein, partial [bacterium]|nr:DUF47 family protein [bacterium]